MPRQDSVTGQSIVSGYGLPTSTLSTIALWAGEEYGCNVNIRFRNHTDIPASRFQFHPNRCLFKDDTGRIVLEQRFHRDLPDHPIRPWTHARNGPYVVTFTPVFAEGFSLVRDGATIREIPKFEFVGGRGYAEYQTQLRGKAFVHEFIAKKIDPKNNDDVKNEQHAIKLWDDIRNDHGRSMSVPITSGNHLGFLDIKLQWFGLKVVAPDRVRLQFHEPQDGMSSPGPSNNRFRRRSTVLSIVPKVLRTSPRLEPGPSEPAVQIDAAPTKIRTRYAHLEITFNTPADCRHFQDIHADRSSSRQSNAGLGILEPEPPGLSPSPHSDRNAISPPLITHRPNSGFSSLTEPLSPISSDMSFPSPALASTIPTSNLTRPLSADDFAAAPAMNLPASIPSPFLTERICDLPGDARADILRPGGAPPVGSLQSPGIFVQNEGIYDTLTASEIRLLRIKKGDDDDVLSCTLQHYSLATAPAYEAVSYCWGELGKPEYIMIGRSQSFQVTKHLWEGLRRLRSEEQDRLVWIDAVCINQADNREKNLQIPLMRQIYQNAQRTLIWIGNLGMERGNCQRQWWAKKDDPAHDHRTLCTRDGPDELVHPYADLEELLQTFKHAARKSGSLNVWWKRLWVIQEYHFSARPPIVYFGSHSVDWNYFDQTLCGPSDMDDPLAPFRQLGTSDRSEISCEPRPLFDLLCLASSFHCVNGRDRVYGLLSMHYDEQEQHRPDVRRIQPDYGKSVLQVLEETCEYLVRESKSLDVLLDRRVDRNLWGPDRLAGTVPTWVPDFTSLIPRESWRPDERAAGTGQGRKHADVELIKIHAASDLHSPSILRVRGIRFERIVRRTTRDDFLNYERAPSGRLIYSSLQRRGHLLGKILDILQYSCDSTSKFDKLERRPYLSWLMLGYVFEDKRNLVAELKNKIKVRSGDPTWKYKEQRTRDLSYVQSTDGAETLTSSSRTKDVEYVTERWRVKLDRATQAMWIPERLQALLNDATRDDHNSIRDDFKMAREFENLYAYARTTTERYYFTTTDFDAPMRADVLRCRTADEFHNLTRHDTPLPEYHEYSEKNRERDFFITEGGFIGLGTSALAVDDVVVVPFGSGSPWILREHRVGEMMYYKFVGEAVVPSIMTGALLTQKNASEEVFELM